MAEKKKNKKKGSIRAWSITPYLLLTVNHYGKYTKVDKIFVFISQIIITSEAQFSQFKTTGITTKKELQIHNTYL